MNRRSFRLVSATLFLGLIAALGAVTPAQAATAPARVNIGPTATVGRFDTAVLNIWTACRDQALVAELTVEVTQDTVSGSRSGDFGITCDGGFHRVQVELFSDTGDPFNAGPVHVTALLTVLDPDSMDPLPQGRDSADVTLLAAVDVKIGGPVHLNKDGSVGVPVKTRCQRPWVDAGLDVDVSQNAGTNGGGTFVGDGALVCDARWHKRIVRVIPTSPFAVGSVHIDVFLTVYDPDSFDPVDQARASADRRVVRS
jgi:hypothetical protein